MGKFFWFLVIWSWNDNRIFVNFRDSLGMVNDHVRIKLFYFEYAIFDVTFLHVGHVEMFGIVLAIWIVNYCQFFQTWKNQVFGNL